MSYGVRIESELYKEKTVYRITATNRNGSTLNITTFGARIVSLTLPFSRSKEPLDIALGYDTIGEYDHDGLYSGAIVGRVANRVKSPFFCKYSTIDMEGKESVQQVECKPPVNHFSTSLHGGTNGFSNVIWELENATTLKNGDITISLKYFSKDGEEGYPGDLTVFVNYIFTNNNELVIEYRSEVEKACTPLILTNHLYVNLSGQGSGPIHDHLLQLNSSSFASINDENLTDGTYISLDNVPKMDFRKPKRIGDDIDCTDIATIVKCKGYDHYYLLDKGTDIPHHYKYTNAQLALSLVSKANGVQLNVFTTEPGVQIYTGNWISSLKGKKGKTYTARAGIAIEAQKPPGSVHHKDWKSVLLLPGQVETQTTVYQFLKL